MYENVEDVFQFQLSFVYLNEDHFDVFVCLIYVDEISFYKEKSVCVCVC